MHPNKKIYLSLVICIALYFSAAGHVALKVGYARGVTKASVLNDLVS